MKTVNLAGTNIDLLFPNIYYFLEKIKDNKPFHYIRANHGMWDRHYAVYMNNYMGSHYTIDDLEKLCIEKNYKQISDDLLKYMHYGYYIGPKNTLGEKMESFQKLFIEYKQFSDKLMCAVSVGVGLDELWGRWPRENDIQIGRNKIVELFAKNTNGRYYHSGLLKHWAVTGEIYKLFNLLNELDFRVIFLGPKYFNHSEKIFEINDFKFIEIPSRSAIDGFEQNVNQILELSKDKKTILFHSTGHEGAAYFAEKLINTNIFGFDIGRNIDNIYLDAKIESEDMTDIQSCWYRATGKEKIINHIKYLERISKQI